MDNKDSFPLAYDAILNSFYLDDYIASVPTLGEAQCVSRETRESLKQGGFRLTKFLSNKKLALQHNPCEDHDEIKTSTRVLGQNWKIDSDEFFVGPLQNFPTLADNYTQRKVFSLLSSIFDPLGIIAPVTIRLKALLQQIWRLGLKWDNQIPSDHQHKLQKILASFLRMERIYLPRILFPNQSNKSWSLEIHAFTDASLIGMAAVLFLRMHNLDETVIECKFLIGKSKVVPIKQLSVPKLELEAATIGARLLSFASRKLHLSRTAVLHV